MVLCRKSYSLIDFKIFLMSRHFGECMTMAKFFTASLVSVLVLESSAHAVCGNGVLDSGEACEDGNIINGDG